MINGLLSDHDNVDHNEKYWGKTLMMMITTNDDDGGYGDDDGDDGDDEDDLWNWVGLAGNNFEEGETKSSCQESLDDI